MTPPDAAAILDRIEAAQRVLVESNAALIALARSLITESQARAADDDEWTRLPPPKDRCRVSGWSRSTILRRIASGTVRGKNVGASHYYAAADVRRLIATSPEKPGHP